MTGGGPIGAMGGPSEILMAAAASLAGTDPSLRLVAVGWATVDTDRSERDFSAAIGSDVARGSALPRDADLGASCRLITIARPGIADVVLLEPDTEGRLAGFLARHGECVAVGWLRRAAGDRQERPVGPSPTAGPFGLETRLPGVGPGDGGPFRFLVVEAGTISP